MSHEPPRFPMPQGKAPTAIPAETRDDTDDTEPKSLVARILTGLATISVEQAGRWFLLAVAVAGWAAPGLYLWTHMSYGWGPCKHRQTLEVLERLAPEAAQPGGPRPVAVPVPPGVR